MLSLYGTQLIELMWSFPEPASPAEQRTGSNPGSDNALRSTASFWVSKTDFTPKQAASPFPPINAKPLAPISAFARQQAVVSAALHSGTITAEPAKPGSNTRHRAAELPGSPSHRPDTHPRCLTRQGPNRSACPTQHRSSRDGGGHRDGAAGSQSPPHREAPGTLAAVSLPRLGSRSAPLAATSPLQVSPLSATASPTKPQLQPMQKNQLTQSLTPSTWRPGPAGVPPRAPETRSLAQRFKSPSE